MKKTFLSVMMLLVLVGCKSDGPTVIEPNFDVLKDKLLIQKGQGTPAILQRDVSVDLLDYMNGFAFDDNLMVSTFSWTGIIDQGYATYESIISSNYSNQNISLKYVFHVLEGTEFFTYKDPLIGDSINFIYKIDDIDGKVVLKKYQLKDLIEASHKSGLVPYSSFPDRAEELNQVDLSDKEIALFQVFGDFSDYIELEKSLFTDVDIINE